jgi:hypothetical protein
MIKEAVSAGFYETADTSEKVIKMQPGSVKRYQRVQILTVAELLVGKKIECPSGPVAREETFAKAERKTRHQQEELF